MCTRSVKILYTCSFPLTMQPIKLRIWSGGPNCQKVPKMNYAHMTRFIDPIRIKGNCYAVERYYSALGSLNFTVNRANVTDMAKHHYFMSTGNILCLIQNSRCYVISRNSL